MNVYMCLHTHTYTHSHLPSGVSSNLSCPWDVQGTGKYGTGAGQKVLPGDVGQVSILQLEALDVMRSHEDFI